MAKSPGAPITARAIVDAIALPLPPARPDRPAIVAAVPASVPDEEEFDVVARLQLARQREDWSLVDEVIAHLLSR